MAVVATAPAVMTLTVNFDSWDFPRQWNIFFFICFGPLLCYQRYYGQGTWTCTTWLSYDTVSKILFESYDFKTAKKLVADLVQKKYDLSSNFVTFVDDSYMTPFISPSGKEILRLSLLSAEDLHATVRAFMNKNCTNLVNGSYLQKQYGHLAAYCFYLQARMMYDGHGCVVPVKDGFAFITMGTPEMLKSGVMKRYICPGMSNQHLT